MAPETEVSKTIGVPLSEPKQDLGTVRDTLLAMQRQYPGQMFFLENSGDDEQGLVVSWIPDWYLSQLVSRLVTWSMLGSYPKSW
jgi:hypothetical protein